MKQTFLLELPNGPFGDPLVIVRIRWSPRVLLLDAGEMAAVGPRTLLETTDVLVTHAHVDHVFGLARLLRQRIGRLERPLRIFGPPGLAARISAHLQGYHWNLVPAYPIDLAVVEVHSDRCEWWRFPRQQGFEPRLDGVEDGPEEGPVLDDDLLSIEARLLEHGSIPTVAWRLREHRSYHIDPVRLREMGFEPGPWITHLKQEFRRQRDRQALVRLPDGREWQLGHLEDSLVRIREGDSLVYASDLAPSRENLSRLAFFATGVRRLVIEAHFLEEHAALAQEHAHLTALLAGSIARQAGVQAVCPLHFSTRYENRIEEIFTEVKRGAGTVSLEDLPSSPEPSAG